ncbi:MAG: hypothetical protein PHW69_09145 [Elusimicrobiaceae bacterium]|nr:hypothetical protein [Elusimicrobiaceae bacterium]
MKKNPIALSAILALCLALTASAHAADIPQPPAEQAAPAAIPDPKTGPLLVAAPAQTPAPKKSVKRKRKVKPLGAKGQENVPGPVMPKLADEKKSAPAPAAKPVEKVKTEPVLVPTAKIERERTKPVIEETVLPPYMPIADRLANQLSVPLHFSIKQQKRVVKTLRYEIDEPVRKLFQEYEEVRAKARRDRFKLNDMTLGMFLVKAQIYEDIRPLLDALQKERLDNLVYNGYFSMYNGPNKGVYVTEPPGAEPAAPAPAAPGFEQPRPADVPASAYPK